MRILSHYHADVSRKVTFIKISKFFYDTTIQPSPSTLDFRRLISCTQFVYGSQYSTAFVIHVLGVKTRSQFLRISCLYLTTSHHSYAVPRLLIWRCQQDLNTSQQQQDDVFVINKTQNSKNSKNTSTGSICSHITQGHRK